MAERKDITPLILAPGRQDELPTAWGLARLLLRAFDPFFLFALALGVFIVCIAAGEWLWVF